MLLTGEDINEVELYWGFEKSRPIFCRMKTKILAGTVHCSNCGLMLVEVLWWPQFSNQDAQVGLLNLFVDIKKKKKTL